MDGSLQSNCIGQEEDGCGFFKQQIREMQVMISQAISLEKNQTEKGAVIIKPPLHPYSWKRQRVSYERNLYGFNKKKRSTKQKEKEICQPLNQKVQCQSISNQSNLKIHQKFIIAEQIYQKQLTSVKLLPEIMTQKVDICVNFQQKGQDLEVKPTTIHQSCQQKEKSNQILDLAYIQAPDTKNLLIQEEYLAFFLQKQLDQSNKSLTQQLQDVQNVKDQQILLVSCDLQSVSIDLNPKKSTKDKKIKKGLPQKIFLQKCKQNSFESAIYIQHPNSISNNDSSINKSSVQSQKSISLISAITRQLEKVNLSVIENSPKREIIAEIFTNGCVNLVKIESVFVIPIQKTIESTSKNDWKIITFHETKYEFPGKEYHNHVKKLKLCLLRVPDLQINVKKDEQYYEILGGLMVKIAEAKLKCTNCSAKMHVILKNNSNTATESCQKCSMTLKIAVNSITILQN